MRPYRSSVRSYPEDCDNNVHRAWHRGSGLLQLMVDGQEYSGIHDVADWHLLPGLTEE